MGKDSKKTEPTQTKQLYRSRDNSVIAGVAGGLGEYFSIDPVVFRLLFIFFIFFGGFAIPLYIVLWIILPHEPQKGIATETTMKHNLAEMQIKAKTLVKDVRDNKTKDRTKKIIAIILIALGLIIFLNSLGIFDATILWPLIFIILGFFILKS